MKTKSVFILTVLLLTCSVYAQKNVNVDNLRFAYWERLLPKKPQQPMFFYYSIEMDMPRSVKIHVDEGQLQDQLVIAGQRYTDDPKEGDMLVHLKMAPVNILNSTVKERVVESKSKSGEVTRTYYYWVEVNYNFEAQAVASISQVKKEAYSLYNRVHTQAFKSQEYNTRKGASDYWNNNREVLVEQFTRECADNAIKKLTTSLSADFGFPIVKTSVLIKTINEKKHPENDLLRSKSSQLKATMEKLDGKTPLAKEDMKELIAYFKSIPERYTDTELKADVRLRYVAFYNLCRIYLFLDQPKNVKKWADLLFANGHDKKDAERLTEDAESLHKRLNQTIIKATQFDTEDYFTEE